MRLEVDENLGHACVEILRRRGHGVTTVHEQGLCSAPDPDVIRTCGDEGRCLVTPDQGFVSPLVFRPSKYGGIAVLRLPATP